MWEPTVAMSAPASTTISALFAVNAARLWLDKMGRESDTRLRKR